MGYPPSVGDFQAYFVREFVYGSGPSTVMSTDIQRALSQMRLVFNPAVWISADEIQIAFLTGSAHFLVLNIQSAGGLAAVNHGLGVNSKGGGTIESKGVGSANVAFAVPDFVRQSPILSQFMRTDFGQLYLQLLTPRLVGNIQTVLGDFSQDMGLAQPPLPLSITTLSLASASHGVSYTQALLATGGISPLTWSIASGTLPSGLSLNTSSGLITGTPVSAGTSYFEVQVTDGNGVAAKMNYQLVVA